jgi:Sigma-70 region 2
MTAGRWGCRGVQAGVDPIDPAEELGSSPEAEGFEAFYHREYHAVVQLAYALSGSRLIAKDIAQEAFLRAFRDWAAIRHPSGWVRKVVVRRAGRTVHRRLLNWHRAVPSWLTWSSGVAAGCTPFPGRLPGRNPEARPRSRTPAPWSRSTGTACSPWSPMV